MLRPLLLVALAACATPAPDETCARAWWHDADGDGFGGRDETWIGCDAPPHWVAGAPDCDDANPVVHPDAPELCNGADDDCDGVIDEAPTDAIRLYRDDDGDGFGVSTDERVDCDGVPGWAKKKSDCDDTRADVNPDADETCDAIDHDCDGDPVLGAVDGEPWFADGDGDGHGDPNAASTGCGTPPAGWSLAPDDCDDTDPAAHPGAPELFADGADQSCDGLELCPMDGDGDGWAGTDTILADLACAAAGASPILGDCDDTDPAVSPSAVELAYNGVDDDCSPLTRDDDLDGDGWLAAEECDDLDPTRTPDNPALPAFTDVTTDVGLGGVHWDPIAVPASCPDDAEWSTGGAAVADYDDDGRIDVFLPRIGAPDLLYRQLPDGAFDEVGAAAGVAWPGSSAGALWVDVNADGRLDLLVTMVGPEPNRLYVADGAGGFTEQAAARGVALPLTDPTACSLTLSASAGDADGDGDLDLHLAAWQPGDLAGSDRGRLLLNDGTGAFTDATPLADTTFHAARTSAFVDVDADGAPELAIAGDFGTTALFRNDRPGFTDVTAPSGFGPGDAETGMAWGDLDGDGDLDAFLTGVFDPLCAGWPCTGNRLLLNDGAGGFTDATDAARVRDGGWGQGAALADLDLDGDLDIAQQNGMTVAPFTADRARLFLNTGTALFQEQACVHQADLPGQGRAVVPFDADADGDLDLLLTFAAAAPILLRNDDAAATGTWLRVSLRDPGSSNPFAIGAVVRALPAGAPAQLRTVDANATYLAAGPPEAHFGLGAATAVDLEITWPDGALQLAPAVPAGQHLTVVRAVP